MIDFIICDDNDYVRKINQQIVSKATINYDFNYGVKVFSRYNEKLKKEINNTSNIKIYILDIEMPGKSGIEIAKEIRKVDWDSIIIILTTHEELELKVLKQKLLIFDFVSKFDNYETKIIEAIELVLKRLISTEDRVITLKSHNELYYVKLDSILYVYRDSYAQTTVVVTEKERYDVNVTLSFISNKLTKNFIKTHRACYVNKNKISHIDFYTRKIYFSNDDSIDYLSRNYRKTLEAALK